MDTNVDLYLVLGLEGERRKISETQIEEAYQMTRLSFRRDFDVRSPLETIAEVKGDDESVPLYNETSEQCGYNLTSVDYAFSILGSLKMRRIYDRYGHSGLAYYQESHSRSHTDSLLSAQTMFDRLRSRSKKNDSVDQRRITKRSPILKQRFSVPILATMTLTLEECYKGTERTVKIFRNTLCSCLLENEYFRRYREVGLVNRETSVVTVCLECNGTGGAMINSIKDSKTHTHFRTCTECGGNGVTLDFHRVNGIQDPCEKCENKCFFSELLEEKVILPPGIGEGNKITFEGQGHETIDDGRGDIIVSIVESDVISFRMFDDEEKEDLDPKVQGIETREDKLLTKEESKFSFSTRRTLNLIDVPDLKRIKNKNLFFELSYGMTEFMFGIDVEVTHLDGHKFFIADDHPMDGKVLEIKSEGLPIWADEENEEKSSEIEYESMLVRLKFIAPKDKHEKINEKLSKSERSVFYNILRFLDR